MKEEIIITAVTVGIVVLAILVMVFFAQSIKEQNLGKVTDFEISKGWGTTCKVTLDNNQSYMPATCEELTTTKCLYKITTRAGSQFLFVKECDEAME